MEVIRFITHYGIHFIVPIGIAFFFYRRNFKNALFLLWAGILIDIDHVIADPIFDAMRCSIGFHPLHSNWMIGAYLLLVLVPKTRLIGLALCIHILADTVDCLFL